jgi:hypothetical protein
VQLLISFFFGFDGPDLLTDGEHAGPFITLVGLMVVLALIEVEPSLLPRAALVFELLLLANVFSYLSLDDAGVELAFDKMVLIPDAEHVFGQMFVDEDEGAFGSGCEGVQHLQFDDEHVVLADFDLFEEEMLVTAARVDIQVFEYFPFGAQLGIEEVVYQYISVLGTLNFLYC